MEGGATPVTSCHGRVPPPERNDPCSFPESFLYVDDVEGAEGSGAVCDRDDFFAGKRDDPRREEEEAFDEFFK